MQASLKPLVSTYLCSPARTLYEACREAGRDENGRACGACPVNDICAADRSRAARPHVD